MISSRGLRVTSIFYKGPNLYYSSSSWNILAHLNHEPCHNITILSWIYAWINLLLLSSKYNKLSYKISRSVPSFKWFGSLY